MMKGDNEMILGAVHRSPSICLPAEENPRKPQLGDCLMKGLATSHRLKWAGRADNISEREKDERGLGL